jgi:hypothetical protein
VVFFNGQRRVTRNCHFHCKIKDSGQDGQDGHDILALRYGDKRCSFFKLLPLRIFQLTKRYSHHA